MHTRLGQALEDKKLSEAEAKTYEVVDTFWKQVWRMWKDKGQSDHKQGCRICVSVSALLTGTFLFCQALFMSDPKWPKYDPK